MAKLVWFILFVFLFLWIGYFSFWAAVLWTIITFACLLVVCGILMALGIR